MNPGPKCEQISFSALSTAQERPLLVLKMLLPKLPSAKLTKRALSVSVYNTGCRKPREHTRHSKPETLEQFKSFWWSPHGLGDNTPSIADRLILHKSPSKRAYPEHGQNIRGVPGSREQTSSDVTRGQS